MAVGTGIDRVALLKLLKEAVETVPGRDRYFRNSLICALVRSDRVSEDNIAACFGLTKQRVSQIAAEHGIPVVPKKSPRARAQERLEKLATKEGLREVTAVMAKVAADDHFWTSRTGQRGCLKKGKVLWALGFPKCGRTPQAEIWHQLVTRKIIEEWLLVGVVLRYGLGVDPATFIRKHYGTEAACLADITETINREAVRRDLLTIGQGTLSYYMQKMGIPRKTSGSRNPVWLQR